MSTLQEYGLRREHIGVITQYESGTGSVLYFDIASSQRREVTLHGSSVQQQAYREDVLYLVPKPHAAQPMLGDTFALCFLANNIVFFGEVAAVRAGLDVVHGRAPNLYRARPETRELMDAIRERTDSVVFIRGPEETLEKLLGVAFEMLSKAYPILTLSTAVGRQWGFGVARNITPQETQQQITVQMETRLRAWLMFFKTEYEYWNVPSFLKNDFSVNGRLLISRNTIYPLPRLQTAPVPEADLADWRPREMGSPFKEVHEAVSVTVNKDGSGSFLTYVATPPAVTNEDKCLRTTYAVRMPTHWGASFFSRWKGTFCEYMFFARFNTLQELDTLMNMNNQGYVRLGKQFQVNFPVNITAFFGMTDASSCPKWVRVRMSPMLQISEPRLAIRKNKNEVLWLVKRGSVQLQAVGEIGN